MKISRRELLDCLAYAATSQQVELTTATVEVYYDQLCDFTAEELQRAVRQWVATYDDPYRRLPSIGEIKAILRSLGAGQKRMDPELVADLEMMRKVRLARQHGISQEKIDAIIEDRTAKNLGKND